MARSQWRRVAEVRQIANPLQCRWCCGAMADTTSTRPVVGVNGERLSAAHCVGVSSRLASTVVNSSRAFFQCSQPTRIFFSSKAACFAMRAASAAIPVQRQGRCSEVVSISEILGLSPHVANTILQLFGTIPRSGRLLLWQKPAATWSDRWQLNCMANTTSHARTT
jgi:hypothetical protein